MDPIAAIKKRAEEKRDYAIRLARQVYQRDVMAIEAWTEPCRSKPS